MAQTDTTMQLPRPTEYHAKLNKIAGKYVADEKIHPNPMDPKGGTAKGRMTARMDLRGFWLLMDYEQERDGQVGYQAHGTFGYDPARKMYSIYWTSSFALSTS